jgi:drug/metabolite transporter (DMT)-like permease
MLAAVGVIHFVIGRQLAYDSFRHIGANRATPITQISPAFTVILSWIFLTEGLTLYVGLGAACMMAGVFLVGRERGRNVDRKSKRTRDEARVSFTRSGRRCAGASRRY